MLLTYLYFFIFQIDTLLSDPSWGHLWFTWIRMRLLSGYTLDMKQLLQQSYKSPNSISTVTASTHVLTFPVSPNPRPICIHEQTL